MKQTNRVLIIAALFALVVPLMIAGSAGAMYLTDGTKEVSPGVYENPNDGMCIVGVAANGDMLVDTTITNARDCVAYTTGLTGITTQAACLNAAAGNDGYKHAWATTNTCINASNPTVAISLEGLDRTLAMCQSRGGTTLTSTGTCVAYGWQYRNRKADGTVPAVPNMTPTKGVAAADNLGFCYAPVRMTTVGTFDALTCPSINNLPKYCNAGTNIGLACTNDASCTGAGAGSCVRNTTDWPDCASNNPTPASTSIGCQTAEAYDEGLGWSYASGQCIYAYGVDGYANGTLTRADGTTYAAGAAIVPNNFTTMGDCLSQGFSWDNWLPVTATTLVADIPTTLGATDIRKFDTTTPVASGGGQFHSGTGAICTKCHSDQSRAYMERNKAAYIATGHKSAGDDPSKSWTTNFTSANSAWGLKGVQCTICHGTARPGQADLLQVSTGTTPAPAGTAKYASGHQNLALGTAATQLCFECHGTATTPETDNPALVIPVSAGEFSNTPMGLAPIANQFLNSPHAKYAGDSAPLSLTTKANYGTTFVGYNCRTSANGGSYVTTVYQSGEAKFMHFLDSLTNTDCTNPGDGSATSGAAGIWQREGSNIDSATANRTDAGNCTTCHDVHWSLDSAEANAEPLRRECTTCHVNPGTSASGARQVLIASLVHPTSAGTPVAIATANGKPSQSCEICHMPKLTSEGSFAHLWRISRDASYVTAGASGANLDVDGNAWVDLASACGQCHKAGGTAYAFTTTQLAAAVPGIHFTATDMNCMGCHNSTMGSYAAIVPGTNHHYGTCSTCHGTATYPLHQGATVITKTDSNTIGASCATASCHGSAQTRTSNASTIRAIVYSGAGDNHHKGSSTARGPHLLKGCLYCHGAQGGVPYGTSSTDVMLDQTASGSCSGACHATSQAAGGKHHTGAGLTPVTYGGSSFVCLACHTVGPDGRGNGAPGVTDAAVWPPASWENCTACHTTEQGTVPAISIVNHMTGTGMPGTCLKCHDVAAQAGPPATTGSFIGVKPDTQSTCGQLSCHSNVATIANAAATMHGNGVITPDVTVSNLTVPANGGAGKTVNVTYTVKNIGTGSAGTSNTKFYISANGQPSGSVLATRPTGTVAANGTFTETISLAVPASPNLGTFYVVAVADADSALTEVSESNNKAFKMLRVGPDYTLGSIIAPSSGVRGGTISVNVTTRNSGAGDAVAASTTKFYLSTNGQAANSIPGGSLGSIAVAALTGGTSYTPGASVVLSIPGTIAAGKYYVVAVADDGNAVAEVYETNNVLFRQIMIQ